MSRRIFALSYLLSGSLLLSAAPGHTVSDDPQITNVPGWGEVVNLRTAPDGFHARVQGAVNGYDYPARAMRLREYGIVEGWAVFGPDGKALQVGVSSAPSKQLAETTTMILMRRLRMKFPEWPGKSVRLALPPIQYRFRDCKGEWVEPRREGVVLIEIEANCQRLIATPAAVKGN